VDFWDLTKLLKRRWYLSLPILLLTAVASIYTLTSMKPDYVATSHVQVFPPASRPAEQGEPSLEQRNPWMMLGVYNLANAAMLTIQQQSVVEALVAADLSDTYTATLGSGMPIVTIEVTGTSQEQAIATSDELIRRFSASVVDLQAQVYGVSTADLATARSIDLGPNVEPSTGRVKRAVIGIAGAGVVLAVAVSVAVDSLALRRRRRLAPEAEDLVEEPAPAAAPAPRARPSTAAAVARSGSSAPPTHPLALGSADQSPGFDDDDGTVVLPLALQAPRRRDDRETDRR
jgi:capsular polysaccharide biosynthesis protein